MTHFFSRDACRQLCPQLRRPAWSSLAMSIMVALHCLTTAPAAFAQQAAAPSIAWPSAQQMQDATAAQRAAIPALDQLPGTAPPTLADLAERFEQQSRPTVQWDATAPTERTLSGLVVFASLGMPTASLERLVRDAERVGAVIVLRGVIDRSLTASAQRIRALLVPEGSPTGAAAPMRRVAFQIDPMLFRRFGVQAVPAVMLIDPAAPVNTACSDDRCRVERLARVAGDVSLKHALLRIADADTGFAPLARRFAEKLGGDW